MRLKLFFFLLFISALIPKNTISQINIGDSLALVDFYDSTNGDNWTGNFNLNWKTSAPVSTWTSVTVRNNRVVGMYMTGNHLYGFIPPSFKNLDSMKNLTFIDNGFSLDFLPYISYFKDIKSIHIGEQYLPGPIPSSWGQLSKLEELTVYGPSLAGPIPASLGNLTNLTYLDVGNSKHSGPIPAAELSNLDLWYFLLSANLYTFKEIEPLVTIFTAKGKDGVLDYGTQADIPTIQDNDNLMVEAGGVPGHNTYQWYKSGTGLVATVTGDSTFRPTTPGTYYASITNSVATHLTLNSIPIKASSVAVPLCPLSAAVTLSADVTGTQYQWQESVDSIHFYDVHDNANFSGTDTSVLKIQNVPSSWYGRKYRCIANVTTSTAFTIFFPNTWVASGPANWEDATKWSCGKVPDAGTDVIINSGSVELNSNVTVRSLTLGNGATFTVGAGYKVTITN